MSLLEKLAELANELDAKGYYDEATQIDQVIKKAAEVNMDDDQMKPHNPPPQNAPAPDLKTTTPPPGATKLPEKKERPAPAPQSQAAAPAVPAGTSPQQADDEDASWDDDKEELGAEWKAIEKRLKKLPEDKWEDMLELLKDNMEKIEDELDEDEDEADDVEQNFEEIADDSKKSEKIFKKHDKAKTLPKKVQNGKIKGKKPSGHLPKVHDPKTASMMNYANDGVYMAVKKIKDILNGLDNEEAEEAHKLLKALLHKMSEQKADTPHDMPPAQRPKSLPAPDDMGTSKNVPNPPLSQNKRDIGP